MLVIDSSNENHLKCCWCSRKHVTFNVEDHILVKNSYKFKGYRAKNSKFPSTRQPGNGRRQSASTRRTVENVDIVNDLVLSHKVALNHVSNCKGDRHSSLASVQHYSSGFSINMSEESRNGVCRNSLRQLCIVRLAARVTR